MNDKLVLEIEAAAKVYPWRGTFLAIASPANILALITEMRRMKEALEEIEACRDNCGDAQIARAALGGAE